MCFTTEHNSAVPGGPMSKRFTLTCAVAALLAVGVRADDPPDFKPDARYTGSSFNGWKMLGQAEWKAQNGEIAGKPTAESGGWLMGLPALQDVLFFANVKCDGKCRTGVLLRAEPTTDGGWKGIFMSLTDGDF